MLVWVQVPPPAPVNLSEALTSLQRNELTLPQLLEELWTHIHALEPKVRAFVALADPDTLVAEGRLLADRPLCGVPVAVKDNICTAGFPTSCGSRFLQLFRPPFDATCVARLRAAGAQVQGKTNLDEFAMGSSTEHAAGAPTRNPHDLTRSPGGSSGGSAAAVAAGEALAALGSDTGGSVRQPAALCGVVGLRPSYGLVSRWGLVSFASSLDTVGFLTRSVKDAARLLGVIAGPDPQDATTLAVDIRDYDQYLVQDLRGLRLGFPAGHAAPLLGEEARALTARWRELARELGAEVVEVELPTLRYALPAYHLLASAEASANLARYDGVRYTPRVEAPNALASIAASRTQAFSREAKRRITLGTFVLSADYAERYYTKAQRVRTAIAQELARAFSDFDLLLTPTSPGPAFPLGERETDPIAMYHCDVFTAPASLAGLPAISLPGGRVEGLPFGLQLIAPRLEEQRLLSAAHAMELGVRSEE
ncbi:MAG: Asp-tRNA(Asn)/Glu-tRNA(Gln) amidotransferase subunit GatA [Candidatus Bipolaricaulota bacterium]